MTGYDNLRLLSGMEPHISKQDLEESVRKVRLSQRIHDKVNTYSLGMKQRLGIAQALMKKPPLLILDEPTNGLDPAGMREFRQLIQTLAAEEGMTILVSSHLLSEVQMMCDEVAVILHGEIIKTAKSGRPYSGSQGNLACSECTRGIESTGRTVSADGH